MNHFAAIEIGYREQPIKCCAICKHVSYSKTTCLLPNLLSGTDQLLGRADVCPTSVCDCFEPRDADQDKEVEDIYGSHERSHHD